MLQTLPAPAEHHVPIDAETRGRRRLWFEQTTTAHQQLLAARNSSPVALAAWNFGRARGRWRSKGWHVLSSTFKPPLAHLECSELHGPAAPLAVWTSLSVGPSPFHSTDQYTLTPDEEQQAVVVAAIVAGRLKRGGCLAISSPAGTSVSSHAIGRLLQRWPGADVDALVLDLHRRLLSAPVSSVEAMIARQFVVPDPDGRGGWWCAAAMHPTKSGEAEFHVRARTWLDRDMMHFDAQSATSAGLLAPHDDGPALSQTLMLPLPLRSVSH
jgi:hypothetical protein